MDRCSGVLCMTHGLEPMSGGIPQSQRERPRVHGRGIITIQSVSVHVHQVRLIHNAYVRSTLLILTYATFLHTHICSLTRQTKTTYCD
jgi:hypothetical protein